MGNITTQNYATATPKTTLPFGVQTPVVYNYAYTYDNLSRLKTANLTQNGSNYFQLAGMSYDNNGNITALNRKLQGVNADVLSYTYKPNSNQIDKVEDSSGNPQFFKAPLSGAGGASYLYDANGNTTKDLNKGISNITYNELI